jgi:dTDP-4-dehydrorhamnose reductase
MKIFITGADGALGSAMQYALRQEHLQFFATDINQLDITDIKKVNETLLYHHPDVILHFAALSNVDACEREKDLAMRVNALGTLGLAIASRKINAKFLYVSTNFVFDGAQEVPYAEYSSPNPVSEYGRTKLLGERHVREICDKYFIVRTSWLFGDRSKTYVPTFLREKNKPASINVICDQFASFTYTVDLAEALLVIIKSENYGIYHIVNKECGSWLDFALKAKDLLHFKTELNPITTEELNLLAARPRYAPLESNHYQFLFNRTMRTWDDALGAYIKTLP